MPKTLRILGVHGLGDHRTSDWKEKWTSTVQTSFPTAEGITLDCRFVTYDDIFAKTKLSAWECAKAFGLLTASGIASLGRRQRGVLSDVSDRIQWTAGYVVAWLADEDFKKKSRKRILDAVRDNEPDIILAHSLGSLVTYNAFSHGDADETKVRAILSKTRYVTLGSQIGNPFVIGNLSNGRIQTLGVNFWHHLYNVHDDVFTAEIRQPGVSNFRQIETPFDIDGMADHAAEHYLGHRSAIENVWRPITQAAVGGRTIGAMPIALAKATPASKRKKQKALLVGINDYPVKENRLEGCVNDVFTMSAVLQECGVPPEAIRTCLDQRATTDGILDRLKWLLDDPQPGDDLIFYYSGHGARIPQYGEDFEPDKHLEALVPWDFDWTPEKAISDDQIYALYSQLPYGCRLIMIFDCCHSGGIHRDGGLRPRGLTPPDDIRHRELKWDVATQMWVQRDFKRINKDFTRNKDVEQTYFGADGATKRIGRASMLRKLSSTEYSRLKKQTRGRKDSTGVGPYLPMIIEACGEQQLSYEYRHGATSHGAFTFSMASILREKREQKITFEKLVTLVRERLVDLKYDQTPQILGPSAIIRQRIPLLPRKGPRVGRAGAR
jgi:hypothetical protein